MVHSRLDPVVSTSSSLRLDPSVATSTLSRETVVNQQLITMEIDTRTPLPNGSALLRHRLFPRAMVWNVHHATQHSGERFNNEHDHAYPSRDDEYASGYAPGYVRPFKTTKLHAHGSPSASPTVDGREQLFRTIGKYLDQRTPDGSDDRVYRHQPQYAHHQPQPYADYAYGRQPESSYDAPLPRGGSASIYDMVRLHNADGHSPSAASTFTASSSRSLSMSSYPSPTHSYSSDHSNSKKRQRGPSGSTVPPANGVARPGMSTSSAKRCSVHDCGKIAVSKGLCRGHGGGRRCTFAGCTKCAQSRSPFCWAHGGGKRCEAPNCRRSRKTKRFCVDHVDMESTVPLAMSTDSDSDHRSHSHAVVDKDAAVTAVAEPHNLAALHLPSLTDALKRAVPTALARASQTVTLPQSRDRLWPVALSAASMSYH